MKNYEETNKSVFDTKEEYIKFTNAWKKFLNGGKARIKRDSYGLRDSPLQSKYHLFYNVAKNTDIVSIVPNDNGVIDTYKVVGFKTNSDGLDDAISNMRMLKVKDLYEVFGYNISQSIIDSVKSKLN